MFYKMQSILGLAVRELVDCKILTSSRNGTVIPSFFTEMQ